jgi:AcrR family transcriptional regulator
VRIEQVSMVNKREIILNRTIDLLIKNGVKKTTIEDIANHSNTSKVTIYKYFSDKDSLYFEICMQIINRYTQQLESILTSNVSYKRKLYDYLDEIHAFFSSGSLGICKELAFYDERIAREYERYLRSYEASTQAFIDEGISNGFVKNDVDRDLFFYYIDMGIVYYQQNDAYRNKLLNDENFQQRFLLFYFDRIFVNGTEILS